MTTKRWFRTQEGWGWVPSTPEGWQLLILYILYLALIAVRLEDEKGTILAALPAFVLHMAVASVLLVAISYWKGER